MTRRVFCGGAASVVVLCTLVGGRPLGAQRPVGFDLVRIGLDGAQQVLGRLPPSVFAPRVSPDGKQIAFETRDPSGPDGARLWVADLSDIAGRRPLPQVVGPANWAPTWTPDGQRLIFIVSGGRPDAIFLRRADGTGEAEHLIDTRSGEGWVANGAQLRFLSLKPNNDYGISLFDMATRTVTPYIDLPGTAQHSSALSPDGKWMAYASNETGRYEVWLESFPRNGQRYQLTREGGGHPMWRADGKALYFDRNSQLFQLAVDTSEPGSVAAPAALPIKGFVQGEYRRQFDLMPDGRSFLMMIPVMP